MASACVGGGREQSNMPHGVERRTMLFSRKALTPVFLFHLRPIMHVAGSRNSGAVPKRPFFAAKRGAPWLPSVVGEEKNQNLIPSFARCNQDMEQNGEKDNAAAAAAAAVGTSWRIPSPSLYLFTLWQK